MAKDKNRDEEVVWDRVGQFLGDMASVGQSVWNRNVSLWSSVSNNIRTEEYGADDMAKDGARMMSAAFDNFEDVWSAITRPPEPQLVATAVPTAFLYFRWQEGVGPEEKAAREEKDGGEKQAPAEPDAPAKQDAGYSLVDPVWILVPPKELAGLPKKAKIELYGPADGVEALRHSLRAHKKRRGYLLQAVARKDVDRKALEPGTYSGAVYVTEPAPRVLANLRIVLQDKPK
jgi:hypothetical protein